MTPSTQKQTKARNALKSFLQTLGPGLITGASDDDPSCIGTYSQVGAQFGYGMLWTMLFSYPLMGGIQEISAQIGRVTGRGIARNMRRYYPRLLAYIIAGLLVLANVINLGADISAMGAALKLLIGGSALLYAAFFAFASLLLQIFIPYTKYVNFLKWLTLVLFAYVATVFVVHVPWGQALRSTFVPTIELKPEYFAGLIAVLGTTISPYLFFWQASEEVEEIERTPEENALKESPRQAPKQLQRIKADTFIGMGISNIIAFFIILTAAVTLHAHGKTDIQSAAQAAEALRPVAGNFAFALFTAGIVGTGLLAVPVLAGSAAYAVSGIFGWPAV
jgi:NRAMP (natural resistance-associated macrophage protein)-like metal ion transporter